MDFSISTEYFCKNFEVGTALMRKGGQQILVTQKKQALTVYAATCLKYTMYCLSKQAILKGESPREDRGQGGHNVLFKQAKLEGASLRECVIPMPTTLV